MFLSLSVVVALPFSASLGVIVHVTPATNIVHSMGISLPMQFFKINAEHSSNYFISSQTPPYSVPLMIAATNGHTQCVERLLEGGALINYQRPVCNNIIMT